MGRSGSLRRNEVSCGIGSTQDTLGVIDLGNLDGQKSYGSQVAGTIKYKSGGEHKEKLECVFVKEGPWKNEKE